MAAARSDALLTARTYRTVRRWRYAGHGNHRHTRMRDPDCHRSDYARDDRSDPGSCRGGQRDKRRRHAEPPALAAQRAEMPKRQIPTVKSPWGQSAAGPAGLRRKQGTARMRRQRKLTKRVERAKCKESSSRRTPRSPKATHARNLSRSSFVRSSEGSVYIRSAVQCVHQTPVQATT